MSVKESSRVLMLKVVLLLTLVGQVCHGNCEVWYTSSGSVCDCHSKGLHKVPSSLPSNTTRLDISYNSLSTLRPEDFRHLPGLEYLNVSKCGVQEVETSTFVGLPGLRELDLSGNPCLENLHHMGDVFGVLLNLRSLYIHEVSVQDVTPLLSLSNLHKLVLTSELAHLPPELARMPNLRVLTFTLCPSVGNLTANSIRPWTNSSISELSFHRCRIQLIENGTFSKFTSLRLLNFACNRDLTIKNVIDVISTSDNVVIQDLILDLTNRNYAVLLANEEHCTTFQHLRRLSIRGANIMSISGDFMLKCLYKLESLAVGFNSPLVMNLEPTSAQMTSFQLSSLDASYLTVTDVRGMFASSGCQDEIWILDNDQYFPPIPQADQSTETRVHKETCLENTDISYKTTSVPKHLVYLKADHVSMVPITGAPSFFSENNLKYLDLSHRLTGAIKFVWNYPVFGLLKLETMNASSFGFSFINMLHFQCMPSLKVLDLSNNSLDDSVFQQPLISETLEYLDLAGNQFRNINSTAFSALTTLRSLHLQNNNIDNLDFLLETLGSLEFLNMARNKITNISDENSAILDHMYNKAETLTVDLSSNPLQCNCQTLDFIHWVQSTQVLSKREQLVCYPLEQRLMEVDVESLSRKCNYQSQKIIGGMTGGVVMIVTVLVSLAYRFRWWLKWKYYNFKLSQLSSRDKEMQALVGSEDFYSAYVIYPHNDDISLKFLVNDLRLKVEHHFQKPAMYFYGRDDIPGTSLLEDMVCGLRASRTAIWVVTPAFLADTLCETTAHFAISHLGRKNNLLVLLRDTFDMVDITQKYVNLLDPKLGLKKIVFSEDTETTHLNVLWQEVDQFLAIYEHSA